jgi:drug/metabolite transporter (DMT)-like permease
MPPTWLVCASAGALLLAVGTLCSKWAQREGTPVLDYVFGRIALQCALAAALWLAFADADGPVRRWLDDADAERRAGAAPAKAPSSRRRWLAWLGWPQLVSAAAFLGLSLLVVVAVRRAPNPGFATSIVSVGIVLVTLLSPLLFASTTLDALGLLGVLLVVAGVALVVVSARRSAAAPTTTK